MHGHGYPPPQQSPTPRPSPATLTALRLVFAALTVLSCGFLGWVAMLRLAVVTRRSRDWWLFAVVVVLTIGLFAYFKALPAEDRMTDAQAVIGVGWLIAVLVGVLTYYLTMEARHYAAPGPYDTRTPAPRAPAVTYQQPAHHQLRAPVQQHPAPPPNPYTVPAPPPTPAPQRLDQVRAELDELSDYLRKEGEGR